MTKNQLFQELAVSERLHLSTAHKAICGTLRIIAETLAKGEPVTLHGFGSFQVIDIPEREGRNPRTGEALIIPAHKAVKFRPGLDLRQSIKASIEK